MIKGINEKPTTDIILSGERLQVSLLKTGTRQGCLVEASPPPPHCDGVGGQAFGR